MKELNLTDFSEDINSDKNPALDKEINIFPSCDDCYIKECFIREHSPYENDSETAIYCRFFSKLVNKDFESSRKEIKLTIKQFLYEK